VKSDANLLAAARTDASAFRALYDRYAEPIHGFHLRRTRDADATFDLTAETFAQAWLSRGRFRDEAGRLGRPVALCHRTPRVVGVRAPPPARAHACQRLGVLERLDREPSAAEPQGTWLDGLDEALADLPAAQREAIELRVVDDPA
jgi:RNA polymerase sigma-70 factor, ECF subfamily